VNQFLTNIICALLAVTSTSLFKVQLSGRLNFTGDISSFSNQLITILCMPLIWLAFVMFTMSQALWLYILSTQKLSIAYPLQLALTISLISIVAHCFFKETIHLKQMFALCLIFLGIALLKT
jgi:multidrug transporter EmrE-like cation transporter